jgi:hypothetical protein
VGSGSGKGQVVVAINGERISNALGRLECGLKWEAGIGARVMVCLDSLHALEEIVALMEGVMTKELSWRQCQTTASPQHAYSLLNLNICIEHAVQAQNTHISVLEPQLVLLISWRTTYRTLRKTQADCMTFCDLTSADP